MKNELIKDHMTTPVISIGKDATFIETHQLMDEKNIRRLPVVDDDKLIGVVSLTDILEAKPSKAKQLSIWELNYLLANLHIEDIMNKEPLTLSPDDRVATAAKHMLDEKIGGIPIIDGSKLVGIITETDIFRMFVEELS